MSKTTTRIVVISAIFLAFALGMLFQESTSPRSVSGQSDMDLGNGNLLNIGTSGNDWTENHILHIGERVGGGRGLRIVNSDNTNGESHARASVVTGGSSGGDPAFLMEVLGEKSWSLGLDNSDNDEFVISNSAALGTGNVFRADPSGEVCIGSGC
jgi:hypothetical protein